MSIEIKKVVVDGKALQLKVINQLESLANEDTTSTCLGYYIIKKKKKYIFESNESLNTFTDYGWSNSKAFKGQLAGDGNRFKSFKSDEARELYFKNYTTIKSKLVETQLFY